MTLMQVVLPEPFGPTRPRISPALRWKLSSSRARKPPKRLTRPSTWSSGCGSGDIDAPAPEQGYEAVGQEQHQRHDQHAVDELKVLRRGNADGVVDAVQNGDAQDRPEHGRGAAEQRKHDGEIGELAAEDRLRIEYGDVPGEHAAGEAGDQRAQQPRDDPFADHVD